MGAAYFYHLTRQSTDEALLPLLGKSLGAGWRVLVRVGDASRIEWLDEKLWLGPDEGFLPHGIAGGPHDADQPILLADTNYDTDYACLMAVEGAVVTAQDVQKAERTCILFEAANEARVTAARHLWTTLTTAGCEAQYWSQESGRWELKAQKG